MLAARSCGCHQAIIACLQALKQYAKQQAIISPTHLEEDEQVGVGRCDVPHLDDVWAAGALLQLSNARQLRGCMCMCACVFVALLQDVVN